MAAKASMLPGLGQPYRHAAKAKVSSNQGSPMGMQPWRRQPYRHAAKSKVSPWTCCQVMHVTMAKAAPWARLNRMRPNRLTCTEMDQNAMRTIYSNNNLQLIDGKSMDFFTFFKFIL